MTDYRHISTTETAKLIRKALKAAFPSAKFSVRSDTYSGGSSIRVTWTDGPTAKEVEAVCGQFEGGGFDGMIDLKYYVHHWLLPDGTVSVANTTGTEGSGGTVARVDNPKPHPQAELVSFGNDFLFCNRDVSEFFVERVKRDFAKLNPEQRWKLFRATDADSYLAPYERPSSWSFEDPTLPDFGDKAETVFKTMAQRLAA